jgi:hypothetical protein
MLFTPGSLKRREERLCRGDVDQEVRARPRATSGCSDAYASDCDAHEGMASAAHLVRRLKDVLVVR